MARENWIRIGAARSTAVSPAVGALNTTSGAGAGGGGGKAISMVVSRGAVASAIEVASIQARGPVRRTVPATCSQRPVSARAFTSDRKGDFNGRFARRGGLGNRGRLDPGEGTGAADGACNLQPAAGIGARVHV